MEIGEQRIREIAAQAASRSELRTQLLSAAEVEDVAEIGVYRGDFAAEILAACSSIKRYYMIDPWRYLDDWNMPANAPDATFEQFFSEAMHKTAFASDKRIVLRGKTTEVIQGIPDESLDFVYVDGDHTLRGITLDLVRTYPKVRIGGWIGGDDFASSVWQHAGFEPTFVFPYAVYFAEAVDARILGLSHSQFVIRKTELSAFEFVDVTGQLRDLTLRDQLHPMRARRPRAERMHVAHRMKALRRNVAWCLRRLRG